MVQITCREPLTVVEVISKTKSLLKEIHGNEETASKTIQKITINSANFLVISKTVSSEMD